LLQVGEKANVPAESEPLAGLAAVNGQIVSHLEQLQSSKTAILDLDATILACDKRSAKPTYDGRRGYQPVLVLWAEHDVIVADEFRDGNVPAGSGNLRVLKKAVDALPPGVEQVLPRGDSAAYEHELMEFAQAIRDRLRDRRQAESRPARCDHRAAGDGLAIRRAAIRCAAAVGRSGVLPRQQQLASALPLSRHPHPQAAGQPVCRRPRLDVIAYNLLTVLKRTALPEEFKTAKPKTLRFLLFNTLGRIIHHAREILLRLAAALVRELLDAARVKIHAKPAPLAGV
jgi:hypothetical protein